MNFFKFGIYQIDAWELMLTLSALVMTEGLRVIVEEVL